jgi:hypothetical protein
LPNGPLIARVVAGRSAPSLDDFQLVERDDIDPNIAHNALQMTENIARKALSADGEYYVFTVAYEVAYPGGRFLDYIYNCCERSSLFPERCCDKGQ